MSDRIKLSLRVRADYEVAPWVLEEIKRDEAEIERLTKVLDQQLTHACELDDEIERLRAALQSIVGQTDDQFVDGVWREVNTTAQKALKEQSVE